MIFHTILLIASISSISILLLFYFLVFSRLYRYKSANVNFDQPISVIICARNEEENLKKNLPKILKQKYFNFEVIVVNDQSTDKTSYLLEDFSKLYDNLKVVTIDQNVNHKIGKKFALTLGIKTTKHEHLLLTDADCLPNSDTWIKNMGKNFSYADIVLGYGGYEKKKGMLNKFIRFDTFNIAKQYLSFALSGYTYMGVGRNLAYKKSLFFKNKGFASHIHIPSGDDDLFIQEVAKKNIVTIEMSKDTHTRSEVVESWKEWIYQKRRHISTAPFYKPKFKILLILYPSIQVLFWSCIILLFITKSSIYIILSLLGLKLFSSYLINYNPMKRLGVLDLYWIHPLYEIGYLLIQGNFVLLNMFSKPKKWNR